MTKTRARILAHLAEHNPRKGQSPTSHDIEAALGWEPGSAHDMLHGMVRAGWVATDGRDQLAKSKRAPWMWRITDAGRSAITKDSAE